MDKYLVGSHHRNDREGYEKVSIMNSIFIPRVGDSVESVFPFELSKPEGVGVRDGDEGSLSVRSL